MSNRGPEAELHRSVALLATEWWLALGGVAAYLVYGIWVIGTGLALNSVAPSFATTAIATVGTTTVTGLLALAAVAWLVVPAVATAWLLDRQLSNVNGNLVSQYRMDHPGVLPAPSGVCMVLSGAAAVVLGPRPLVLAVMTVSAVHLLVRTLAYGRRVYSFSPQPLFPALSVVSALALAAAWLVHAPALPGTVGQRVAGAGVPAVVAAGLGPTAPGTALGVLVAVPALLSGAYLAVQSVVARRVRARAPLAHPTKRAEQRYPIMPPVADSSRPGSPSTNGSSARDVTSPSSPTDGTDETPTVSSPTDEDETVSADEQNSNTRVFRADEPPADSDGPTTGVGDEEDDDWIDDTAIYSPGGMSSPDGACGGCGESIGGDSVTFCPNCGERVRQ